MEKIVKNEKLKPEEVLMVGDNPITDIAPAQRLGLQSFYFQEDYNELYDFFRSLTNI